MSRSPDRAAALLAKFNATNQALVTKLREMPAAAAEQAPGDGQWSAAQVGWHVALTNDWIAGVLLGSTPEVHSAPAGFKERFDTGAVPAKVKTVAAFEPPSVISRDSALGRLRASGQRVSKAIAALTPERGANYCVSLRFGTLSLFEFADFAASHVERHVAQVDRTLARA
jgi:hypothetical protein